MQICQPKTSTPQDIQVFNISRNDIMRLPSSGLHYGNNINACSGHILSGTDTRRMARKLLDHVL